ncbi:hypothetical protein F0L74_11750 [Chitinophaga agrisoli]|uniref:Immunity protein 35 domain-containing protein n=1 Tax=Chitinophaga agrisoli TaxID=2607653 RepID=A0A5B2VXY4_9BACT|nr:YrhB domain-containing protein [Chitinophaga agrisoli]KAA2243182.1 hypothetical protein F0L74_11750 [Chitinophaga agrisoli]
MITREDAIKIADEYLKSKSEKSKYEFVLLTDAIKEFEYGWIFFYQNKKYLETGDEMHLLGGNGPIVVNKFDGSIFKLGTARKPGYYIEEYIKLMGLKD